MTGTAKLVAFSIDGWRFGLHLSAVERAVRAAEVTPLPGAPASVLGVINVQGALLPVFSMRRRLGLPERDMQLSDHLLLARAQGRRMALLVDEVTTPVQCDAQNTVPAEQLAPGLVRIAGVVRLADGLLLIHDLERFLSRDEELALQSALSASPGDP